MLCLRLFLGPLVLLALTACTSDKGDDTGGPPGPQGRPELTCGDNVDNDEDGLTDCDDDDCEDSEACQVPAVESDCHDEIDNDQDGDFDCDDSDCTADFFCNLPETMDHVSNFDFKGRSLECDTDFGTFPYDVPNCVTVLTASLTQDLSDPCPNCDRTYSGPTKIVKDECSEITGTGGDLPSSLAFGFVFVGVDERELWAKNDTSGLWEKAVDLQQSGSTWSYSTTEAVNTDVDDCDNSPLYVGDLTVTLSFTDK